MKFLKNLRSTVFPSRLFWKIFISLWVAIAGITVIVEWSVDQAFQADLQQSPDLSIGFRAELATSLIESHLRLGGIDSVRQLYSGWSGLRELPVFITDEDGHDLLGRPVPLAARDQAVRLLAESPRNIAVRRVQALNGPSYLLFVPLQMLPSAPPEMHVYRHTHSTRVQLVAMALVSFCFAVGLAWYLYRPIRLLHFASRRFASGELATRLAPSIGGRQDEIADLGRDFDEMATRLQAVVEEKTRLLHDVSHELRSPLARMQIALEFLRQKPEQRDEMIERIAHEIDRLDKTLGETLTLSRLQANTPAPHEECVNLTELIAEIVDDARFESGANGASIELKETREFLVEGRSELLRSAFENVIRNSILHTPEGIAVRVEMTAADDSTVTVRIIDGGPGVAEEELPYLFEPFYRGLRGKRSNGQGLGLSIARRAIELHGGSVTAMNAPDGFCVRIQLPAIKLE